MSPRLKSFKAFVSPFFIGVLCFQLALPLTVLMPHGKSQVYAQGFDENENPLDAARTEHEVKDGLTPEEAQRRYQDPYFISGQRVEYQPSGKAAETFWFSEPNGNFSNPSLVYSLDRDVKVEFSDTQLRLSLDSFNGSSLGKSYTHVFEIPGIQQVLKDEMHVHLVMKNGEIRSIMLAHLGLFKPNELAGGFPLLNAFVGNIPHNLKEGSRLGSNVVVEFYDSRNNYVFNENASKDARQQLRYGDLVVLNNVDGQRKVERVITYKEITEGLLAHIDFLELRERLLSETQSSPFERIFEAVGGKDSAFDSPQIKRVINQATEKALGTAMARQGVDVGQVLQGILSNPSLARAFRPRQQLWEEKPWESPGFEYPHLEELRAHVSAVSSLASDTRARSSYPFVYGHETELDLGTREGRLDQQIKVFTNDHRFAATSGKKLGRALKNTVLGFRFVGKAALKLGLTVTGVASIVHVAQGGSVSTIGENLVFLMDSTFNGLVAMMPTAVTDLSYKVKLFDAFGYQGPEVIYSVKFLLGIAALSGIVWMAPKIFARGAKRILGRPMPHTRAVGWKVAFTIALRVCARLLMSTRSLAAKMVGKEDAIQAMRYGLPLSEYKRASKNPNRSSINSSTLQSLDENQRITARVLAAELLREKLKENVEGGFSLEKVKEKQSFNDIENLEKRFHLLEDSILSRLKAESVQIDDPMAYQRLKTLYLSDPELVNQTYNPFQQLSADEEKQYAKVLKRDSKRRRSAKLAGNNTFFYMFKSGEVSDNVASDALGNNFEKDMHTIWLFTGMIREFGSKPDPNDPAVASLPTEEARTAQMLQMEEMQAGSQLGLFGFFGMKPFMDWILNVLLWAGNTPSEELTFGKGQVSHISESYRNPQNQDLTSEARKALQANRPATPGESFEAYKKAFKGAEVWDGFGKLGNKVINDLKTVKTILIFGTLTASIAFMADTSWTGHLYTDFSTSMDILVSSVYKVTLGNIWAYAFYRIFWMWQNIGMGHVKSNVKARMERLAELINRTTESYMDFVESKSDANRRLLEANIEKIEAYYAEFERKIPSSILSVSDVQKRAETVLSFASQKPPTAMTHNAFVEWAATISVGVITTVIGVVGLGKAWKWAESFSWYHITGLVAALFVGAKVLQKLGDYGMHRYALTGFIRDGKLQRLEKSMRRYEKARDNAKTSIVKLEKRWGELFENIKELASYYEYVNSVVPPENRVEIPKEVLDYAALGRSEMDISEFARGLLKFVVKNPPAKSKEISAVKRSLKAVSNRCQFTFN